jgi:phosphoribosylformimino-5-aminoimidazole carboxamide ribotide isomerase
MALAKAEYMAKVKGVGVSVGFKVLGVIDLRGELAVRARGGHRDRYQPIDVVAGDTIRSGDAVDLARQYVERFGLTDLYVADLDAIEGRPTNAAHVRRLATARAIWLDSGIASVDDAVRAIQTGAERAIVGLETLPSFDVLESICDHIGPRAVFSLDLRDGRPIARTPDLGQGSPEDLAVRAIGAGAAGLIVLDVARVGSGCGLDFQMLARIRRATPSVPVYAGGGVRSIEDLQRLQHVGCDGALVASALLDGHITEHDLSLHRCR